MYVDADGDGYDNGSSLVCYGNVPTGYATSTNGSDCNDNDASVFTTTTYYVDTDGDGYDSGMANLCAATAPTGYSATTLGTDCNDMDATVFLSTTFYIDVDGDGYDAGTANLCASTAPTGYSATTLGADCNDNDATVNVNCSLAVNNNGMVNFAVQLYPNPFVDNFKLDVKSSSTEPLQIRVYDMLGKLIDEKTVNFNDVITFGLGVNYPTGVYNIIVSQDDNIQTLRAIKR